MSIGCPFSSLHFSKTETETPKSISQVTLCPCPCPSSQTWLALKLENKQLNEALNSTGSLAAKDAGKHHVGGNEGFSVLRLEAV